MNSKEREALKQWLLTPLSRNDANLVTRGVKYWAACTLLPRSQGGNDALVDFESRREMCRGPMQDGTLDGRALPFLMFASNSGDPYESGLDWAPDYLNSDSERLTFSAALVLDALRQRPINHIESAEVATQITFLLEKLAGQGRRIRQEFYRTLYLVVLELQKGVRQQRKHVIWHLWCNAFDYLCLQSVSENLAILSYLLLYSLFDASELATFRMRSDFSERGTSRQAPWK